MRARPLTLSSFPSLASACALAMPLAATLIDCGPGTPEAVTPVLPVASSAPARETAPSATSATSAAAPSKPYPPTATRPQLDRYASVGKEIADPYRWLEDSQAAEVKAWSDAQNGYTRSVLDAAPDRAALHDQISKLLSGASSDYFGLLRRGKSLLAIKSQPPKQQPFLVALASAEDLASEHVVFDPNVADPSGKTAIDWYAASRDGKLVAISLSKGGSESGDVHVFDVQTGKERVGDVVTRVNGGTAGGSVAWNHDGTAFFYTRYPRIGERPGDDANFYQQIYEHKLGTAEATDTYVLGKDFPRIAEVELHAAPTGKAVLARVANGDGGEFTHYYFDGKSWLLLADKGVHVKEAKFGPDGSVFLLSLENAPRGSVLRLDPALLAKIVKGAKDGRVAGFTAETIVAESDVVIEQMEVTAHRLFVVDLVGGPSQIRAFDLAKPSVKPGAALTVVRPARVAAIVPVPVVSAVGQLVSIGGPGDDQILFRNQSFTEPPAWYVYDLKTDKSHKTKLFQTSPASFDDAEVVRATCTSKDGTKVPMSVLRKKGLVLDGSHRAMVGGYGGYSVNRAPRFNPMNRLWLDHDGVLVHTNLRGGGEFGEGWHTQGNLLNKQNVFDDFAACVQEVVAEKYTTTSRLAIIGGSNGGLLMGAELTQHPEMFGAVVSYVGIYDMLRVELTSNGAFNVTEFGTVNDPAQFAALWAYSPYHRVVDGTRYPATLMLTGANDPRVDPWHSRKMIARLQAATASDAPILLRTSNDTGHGIGSPLSAEIDEDTDVYSFLFSRLK